MSKLVLHRPAIVEIDDGGEVPGRADLPGDPMVTIRVEEEGVGFTLTGYGPASLTQFTFPPVTAGRRWWQRLAWWR